VQARQQCAHRNEGRRAGAGREAGAWHCMAPRCEAAPGGGTRGRAARQVREAGDTKGVGASGAGHMGAAVGSTSRCTKGHVAVWAGGRGDGEVTLMDAARPARGRRCRCNHSPACHRPSSVITSIYPHDESISIPRRGLPACVDPRATAMGWQLDDGRLDMDLDLYLVAEPLPPSYR